MNKNGGVRDLTFGGTPIWRRTGLRSRPPPMPKSPLMTPVRRAATGQTYAGNASSLPLTDIACVRQRAPLIVTGKVNNFIASLVTNFVGFLVTIAAVPGQRHGELATLLWCPMHAVKATATGICATVMSQYAIPHGFMLKAP